MVSVSDDLLDRITAHSADLLRLEAGERQKVLAILQDLEKELVAKLTDIDPTGPIRTAYQKTRLTKLLDQTRKTIKTAYGSITKDNSGSLKELASIEGDFSTKTLNAAIPVEVGAVSLSLEQLRTIASDALIQGAPSSEWWADQAADLQAKFTREMRMGMLEGEPLGRLVQRLRGTRANKYTDGIMETSRRNAEALIRSSVQTVANQARLQTWKANEDLISALQWVSTLDSRTTDICIARDGLTWDLEGKPIGHSIPWGGGPPAHWNCRSSVVPVTRTWKELGIDAEEVPASTRASMDGQIAEKVTYEDWLAKKPAEFQNDVLGVGKAKLFRDGKINLRELLDQRGRPLTLEQLRERVG